MLAYTDRLFTFVRPFAGFCQQCLLPIKRKYNTIQLVFISLEQEYSVNVQFGPIPETSWKITKRYSDFAGLDLILKNAGFELQLPPKKVFGKMESDFISKRQQGLQVLSPLTCKITNFFHMVSAVFLAACTIKKY